MIIVPPPHHQGSYMAWMSRQPCICCQVQGVTNHQVQLHHVSVWGLSRRGNNPLRDYTVLPLCQRHHTGDISAHAAHAMDQGLWLRWWGLPEINTVLDRYLRRYCLIHGFNVRDMDTQQVAERLRSLE